jgi:hypothetical protein
MTSSGELRVTCAGGQIVSAVFARQEAGPGKMPVKWSAPELNAASGMSVLRGSWDLGMSNGRRMTPDGAGAVPVVLDSSARFLCRR